jgi:hypothetical protein
MVVLGLAGISLNRVAVAVKAWIDVLAAGVDLEQRKQALEQNRALTIFNCGGYGRA